MTFLKKAKWLVVTRNDKMYVTEDEITVTELSVRLGKQGILWQEIRIILKLPPDKPQRV